MWTFFGVLLRARDPVKFVIESVCYILVESVAR